MSTSERVARIAFADPFGSRVPHFAQAVFAALRFPSSECDRLAHLTDDEWKHALKFSDEAQFTLPLGLRCREYLPEHIRARIDRNLRNNAERWQRIQAVYREAATAFEQDGLEFAVLKGFSHCPLFIGDPCHRPQYDLDLFFPERDLCRARDIALRHGYELLGRHREGRVDHLPTMIRKTGWQWRGDLFDPEIPISLELHFRFWDYETEKFGPEGLESFWDRRMRRELDGLKFTALDPADEIAYSCLHMLRHLLRGDLKPFHVYELASMLKHSASDDALWAAWTEWHHPSLTRLEAICFSLAQRWFNCAMHEAPAENIAQLPSEITRWLDTYADSPVASRFSPNKDELWLHWNLLDSPYARFSVLRRRMLPTALPGAVDAVHVPDSEVTLGIRVRRKWKYLAFAISRVAHHLQSLPVTALSAARWFARAWLDKASPLGRQFWIFFSASLFYNFGLFIFFLLNNLYLLQMGFREDFIGIVTGAMTTGSVVGCIPAAYAIRRFGIRNILLGTFSATICLLALRAMIPFAPVLVALAFASGLSTSVWGVSISPAVALLTIERNRGFGFSLICSSGVGVGVIGAMVGGRLPRWFSQHAAGPFEYRAALLTGCAVAALSLLPVSRLKLNALREPAPTFSRPSPFLLQFFAALLVWNLGTGTFNSFANAFFARHKFPVEHIGALFSSVNLAQAAAMLATPLVLRKMGLTRGISMMQFATALAMIGLASLKGVAAASLAYGAYMIFQYSSEPGVFTFLMNNVAEPQRSGVSAVNILVMFAGQAMAAAIAGTMIARFGYSPVLCAGAIICGVAALLFLALRRTDSSSTQSS